MNGDAKTRVVLVKDNIYWPNGIALDYQTERLWWVDAKIAKIESVNLDGTNRRTELDGNDRDLGHPFSLDVFGEGIFWSEWRQNFLYRCTKKDLDKIAIMKRLKNMIPMDIKVVHPHQQIKGIYIFIFVIVLSIVDIVCFHECLTLGKFLRKILDNFFDITIVY